jgi:hypothetical protein
VNENSVLALSLAASVIIVGGATIAILTTGAKVVDERTPDTPPASRAALAPSPLLKQLATPPPDSAPRTRAESTRTVATMPAVIYRCQHNGSTVYSEVPCVGGRPINTQPAVSSYATRQPPADARSAQRSSSAASRASAADSESAGSDINAQQRSARCDQIRARIESIDAQARAGGIASWQDFLRAERKKLEDLRYELKC